MVPACTRRCRVFPQLVRDFALDESIYAPCGTLVVRPENALQELADLAVSRRKEAPEIGEIELPDRTTNQRGTAIIEGNALITDLRRWSFRWSCLSCARKRVALQQQVTFIEEKAEILRKDSHWQISKARINSLRQRFFV